MTKDQESVFAMILKVKNFGIKKADELVPVPAVAGFLAKLNEKIEQLLKADQGSRLDLSGYAIDKSKKREKVETLALKVSNAVAAFAVVSDDVVLQKKADFPSSKWYAASEEELITQASVVRNLADPISASLPEYGATAADVTELGTAIEKFTNVISNPTLAIDQRKEDNETVGELLQEARTLLSDKLDVVMRSFEVNNPSLYDLYRSARAIDVNGSVQAPTVIEKIDKESFKAIHKAESYNADTFYTIQNQSSVELAFGLSNDTGELPVTLVTLNPGETRSRLASNLSDSGVYLVVQNQTTTSNATVRLWVE